MIHCGVLMELGKTCLLSSQSQWWITFTGLIRHVGSHFVAWQVWQNWFRKYCSSRHVKIASEITLNVISFMHERCKKKKMWIKFLSCWNDPVKGFQRHAIHVRHVSDKTSSLTFLHLRNDVRKSPLLYQGGGLFGESKHPEVDESIKSRAIFFIFPLSCDWWEIISFKILCQIYL